MKLPLFVSSLPFPADSALVMLSAGVWTISTDRKDAILNLSVNGTMYQDIRDGQTITVDYRTPARAAIVQAGTEKYLSLYLDDNSP
jgi:hypothetical protein